MNAARIVVLTEEVSMRAALLELLPRVAPLLPVSPGDVVSFQGRPDLLRKLPGRLAGLRWEIETGTRVVVLLDRDRDDCRALAEHVRQMVRDAGLAGDRAGGPRGDVLVRIVCRELESWFLGDVAALHAAYPRLPRTLTAGAAYRAGDDMPEKPSVALARELAARGYHPAGLNKLQNAERVAQYMNVEENTSVSFCQFRDGVRRLVGKVA